MSKSFNTRLREKDWGGPTVEVLYAAFLVALDVIQILVLIAIAEGGEILINHLHAKPIVISGYEIAATFLVKNFEYMLVALFLFKQAWRFLGTAKTSR